jgi:hypothetical protein
MFELFAIQNNKQREKLVEYVMEMPLPFKAAIQEISKQRDVDLNAAYWVMLGYAEDHTGHTKSELHDKFKKRFLTTYCPEPGTNIWKVRTKSTTELSDNEFANYFNQVRAYLLIELNIDTPTEAEIINNQNPIKCSKIQ